MTKEWLSELCEEVPADPQRASFSASISEVLAVVLENEVSAELLDSSYMINSAYTCRPRCTCMKELNHPLCRTRFRQCQALSAVERKYITLKPL